MSDTLLDISQKIEAHKSAILIIMDRLARRLGIPFFIVGAAARDFILENGHGITAIRATLDIDIGVAVSSWDEFKKLTDALLTDEHFQKTIIEHRFVSPVPQKTLVDILPFGAIENGNRAIHWQQENREMNMAGFSEAYNTAIDVIISTTPPVTIQMVSLAGLAVLKLLSWNDKPLERDRDAKDFRLIMYKYLDAKSGEYVFDVYPDIAGDGDYDRISARSLGRDMKSIAGASLIPLLHDILNRECDQKGNLRFIQQMQAAVIDKELSINRDIEMLNAVRQGIVDAIL
jgi:predicted nucleotidyltransferase